MADIPAYERQPYLAELATEVISTGELDGRPFAILGDTLFYPEGGGQPTDRGVLNDVPVTDVQRAEDGIRHFLATPVSTGPAQLEIDWVRRYDHMQQHTAQHLLTALAAERFGWTTTSFHLGERQCDIELDAAAIEPGALGELEELVLVAVRAARPVTARRITAEAYGAMDIRSRGLPETHSGDVRLVEIEGIDVTTCGGTHVRSTAEIETMRIGPTEPMRGGTRLYWLAGGRVRRRLALLEARNNELRRLFETSGNELVETATGKLEALTTASRTLKRRLTELADAHATALASTSEPLVEAHFVGLDASFLQSVARGVLERSASKVALLTSTADGADLFLVAAGPDSGVDPADAGRQVAEMLGGRGGGAGAVFQGRAGSLERRGEATEILGRMASRPA